MANLWPVQLPDDLAALTFTLQIVSKENSSISVVLLERFPVSPLADRVCDILERLRDSSLEQSLLKQTTWFPSWVAASVSKCSLGWFC